MNDFERGDSDAGEDIGPRMQWDHIDGPMMVRSNGTIKWPTLYERFMLWIGAWTLRCVEQRA